MRKGHGIKAERKSRHLYDLYKMMNHSCITYTYEKRQYPPQKKRYL